MRACSDCAASIRSANRIASHFDIPAARWPAYNLTTIRQPVNRMITATLDLLKERLDNPHAEPVLKLLPGILVPRGSARINITE